MKSADCRSISAEEAEIDVAQALAKIHELGFVHPDVRPENMLVNDAGHYVLANFDGIRPLSDQ